MTTEHLLTNRLISKGINIGTARKAAKILAKAGYSIKMKGIDGLLEAFAEWNEAFGAEAALKELDESIIK